MDQMKQIRNQYLQQWAKIIASNTSNGNLGKQPFLCRVSCVNGPRAGALLIDAGINAGPLLRILNKDESAILRQTIPFNFIGKPLAFMQGKRLRLEAGWPLSIAETMVKLSDLGHASDNPNRWIVGKNELGMTVTASLKDSTASWLLGGQTGSGKTVALRSAALQLSGDNQIVLLDGKYGESLTIAENLLGVVGPCAVDLETVKGALGWVCAEMKSRYQQIAQGLKPQGKLIAVFDEFQAFANDSAISEMLRKIASQGRAAGCHLLAATQHPTVDCFGDSSTRRNLTGRLALTVTNLDASRLVVGDSTPRADHLLGSGDSYALGPGVCHRVQTAYVDGANFDKAPHGDGWLVEEWPTFQAENLGQDIPDAKTNQPTNQELALAILSASVGDGRTKYQNRLQEHGIELAQYTTRKNLERGKAIWKLLENSPELRGFCERMEAEL